MPVKNAKTMKFKKWLLIIAGVVAFYATLGFLVVPWAIKATLPDIVKEQTGKIGFLDNAKFNPFALTLSLKGFEMREPDDEKIIAFAELFINYGVVNSFSKLAVAVDEIRLTNPYTKVKIRQDGVLNLTDLAKSDKLEGDTGKPEQSDELFPIWIKDIKIETGEIDFADHSLNSPFKSKLELLNIRVHNLTTKKSIDGQGLSITAMFGGGGSLDWQGDLVLNPSITSTGMVNVKDLNSHTFWEYAKDRLNFEIRKGDLDIKTDYAFRFKGNTPQLTLGDGNIHLSNLDLASKKSDQTVISIPSLSLTGFSFDLINQSIVIKNIDSKAAQLVTHINKNGELNLKTLFASESASSATVEKPQANSENDDSKPWAVKVIKLALNDYTIAFTQETDGDPLKLDLSPIAIEINHFSNEPANQFALNARLGVNKTGEINTTGKIAIDPVAAKLDIKADGLGLKALQPFLDQSTKLKLLKGNLALDSKLDYKLKENGGPTVGITGNATISDLKTVEAKSKKEFLSWKAVALDDMKFSLDPMTLDIANIDINQISSKVVINKDKSSNIGKIFASPEENSPPKKEKPNAGNNAENPFALYIGNINVANGSTYFADRSIILPFSANIKRLNGSVKNVSSNNKSRSSVLLNGKVNQSPVSIKGSFAPFDVKDYMDIAMSFKGLDLTTATPYMAEFAGYKIEKGKLSLDLGYKIKQKSLSATNKVVVSQLTLGEKVDSPNRVSIPVKLGVALLKDSDGVIDIDLPIEGRLDDPHFSIRGLIGRVLLNLLKKTIASPFAVIGKLVGSDADLSQIEFEPGHSEIREEQTRMLATVAEGLSKRPQLQLAVRGIAYRKNDGKALAEQRVLRDIKAVNWEDLDKDERPANIDEVVLDDEQYQEILSDLLEERFPEQADEMIDKADDAPDSDSAKSAYEEIKQKLVAAIPIEDHDLDDLAKQRASNISKYLTEQTDTSAERIFLLDPAIKSSAENEEINTELKIGVLD